jgi:DNA mismatch endonuclease (patch repair protein)
MAAVRSHDTKPEMLVRRLAHAQGYRFRLRDRDLPGKPDLTFHARSKAIFVHGCFWHQHRGCRAAAMPKTREDFWRTKLEGNRARDARVVSALEEAGWKALVIWQCEIGERQTLARRLTAFLGPTRITHRRPRGGAKSEATQKEVAFQK